ncbi:MAG TPA: hemolysin [Methylococcaceae bacterium]|nr:hemolysin [Methylococcaceae bacterium]
MKLIDTQIRVSPTRRLDCFVTHDQALIEQAQRLRFQVFAKEMGARLKTDKEGLDYDEIDHFCDHLVVVDTTNEKIVGYTRLLNQEQARKLGYFYSQKEFNLDRVLALPGRFLEIGRTCVDPKYRGSAVLTTLWSALVKYAQLGHYHYLIGCASISPGPSGYAVDAVYRAIDSKNKASDALSVVPLIEVPEHLRCERDESGIPPLLKAYLRFGVQICGRPFWDEDFNVMDLFILLPLAQLEDRYSKHYLKPHLFTDDRNLSPAL